MLAPFRLGAIAAAIRTLISSADSYFGHTVLSLHGNVDPSYSSVSLLLRGDGANGSTTFTDNGPTPKAVTANGNAQISTAQSKFGGASMLFDGTGDFLALPTSSDWNFGTGDFTIEAWVNPANLTGIKSIFGGGVGEFIFNLNTSYCECGSFYIAGIATTGGASIVASSWQHVAVSRSGTTLRMFLNGEVKSSVSNSTNITYATVPRVGASTYATDFAYMNGYIDDLRITKGVARYTSNFTPKQIPATNGSAIIVDSSPVPKTVTANGNAIVSTAQAKFGGASMFFDGTGDYVSIPTSTDFDPGTGDFTVEGFYYFAALPTSGTNASLATKYNGTGNQRSWFILFDNTGGVYTIKLATSTDGTNTGASTLTSSAISPSTGTWYHVAWVRTAGANQLYFDGVQIANQAGAPAIFAGSSSVAIGASSDGAAQYLNGYVDDFRITKGFARYIANFAPPAAGFIDAWSDPSLANVSLLLRSDLDLNYSNVSLLLRGDGANASTTFTDNSSSPKTMTASGNAQISTAQSKYGGASMLFDGTGDYLTTPDNAGFAFGSGDFTIETWFRCGSLSGAHMLFSQRTSNTVSNSFACYVFSTGAVYFDCSSSGSATTNSMASAAGSVVINVWVHVAIVRNGNTIRLYLNGTSVASMAFTGSMFDSTSALAIGADGAGSGNFFNGHIDDLRITRNVARYTGNFTPKQIPAVAGSAIFVDASPTPKVITAAGNAVVSTAESKFGGASMLFDGTGDYLTAPNSAAFDFGSGDFAVECWVRFPTAPTGNQGIVSVWNSTGNNRSWNLLFLYNGGASSLRFGYSTDGIAGTNLDFSWVPAANTWYMVAVTRDSGYLRCFVDGAQIGTTQSAATTFFSGTAKLAIGVQSEEAGGSVPFNGYLDDLRITKGVARYTSNFIPPLLTLPDA